MLQRCAEQVFHLAGIGVADGLAPLAAQGRLDQVWVADSPLQRPRSPAELRAEGSLVGKTPSSACVQDGTARPRGRCVLRLPPPQFAAAALENPGARDGGEDLARRRAGQRRPGLAGDRGGEAWAWVVVLVVRDVGLPLPAGEQPDGELGIGPYSGMLRFDEPDGEHVEPRAWQADGRVGRQLRHDVGPFLQGQLAIDDRYEVHVAHVVDVVPEGQRSEGVDPDQAVGLSGCSIADTRMVDPASPYDFELAVAASRPPWSWPGACPSRSCSAHAPTG